jgi:Cft2 family RNA processing exonuclease
VSISSTTTVQISRRYNTTTNIRYKKHGPARKPYASSLPSAMRPASDPDISRRSDKIHVLRAGRVETFPPHVKVKATPAAAIVGVSQVLVEVETGTSADDLGTSN